ncbi:hypothetical protein BJ085DRAFT_36105 [Dimargaris cristalligena]|uniref:Uncharacterized protein n=1 Tax=Dimargaris cristalligena TaxID=215637 RepID=A0A4P9ZZE9_9FUNG|nr:hypothetical protein BJ085DRAFT_36105 [Dimargaris cristalligena]|eukprot:RKP39113.1 hypothetical protein BJ085DRAFT_36105 [Dimargaris cristalligena]
MHIASNLSSRDHFSEFTQTTQPSSSVVSYPPAHTGTEASSSLHSELQPLSVMESQGSSISLFSPIDTNPPAEMRTQDDASHKPREPATCDNKPSIKKSMDPAMEAMLHYLSAPLSLPEVCSEIFRSDSAEPQSTTPLGQTELSTNHPGQAGPTEWQRVLNYLQQLHNDWNTSQTFLEQINETCQNNHKTGHDLLHRIQTEFKDKLDCEMSMHKDRLGRIADALTAHVTDSAAKLADKIQASNYVTASNLDQQALLLSQRLDSSHQCIGNLAQCVQNVTHRLDDVHQRIQAISNQLQTHAALTQQHFLYFFEKNREYLEQQNLILQAIVDIKTMGIPTIPKKQTRKGKCNTSNPPSSTQVGADPGSGTVATETSTSP